MNTNVDENTVVDSNTGADVDMDSTLAVSANRTRNEIISSCTNSFLNDLDLDVHHSAIDIEAELLSYVRKVCLAVNENRSKVDRVRVPNKLCTSQIAMIMLKLHHIVRIACANSTPEYDLLAIYKDSGENEGLYVTDEYEFERIAVEYDITITVQELRDVLEKIRMHAPRVARTTDRDLIAVNNGIFNFKTKQLELFTPDYVFLAKSKVNYNPWAKNVTIHNDEDGTDWDIETWMSELSDDPDICELLWQILSAIVRPFVRWDKSAWFYSNTGNNGKGTLCELMRSLCGEGSYASISLNDFGKDFALEPLTRATAIIVDENDVGTFIDKAANLKAVITNDVVSINRKFKTPISYQVYGFMVQCLNELPRIKDKSDSFYRRQLFIPFDKCFTGKERKYIKNDYLHRKEVLEHVLYKVLNMNFYTLSEPASCKAALNEYKEYNDPVRQYLDEMLPVFTWDLVPFSFLYDLYKAWFRKNSPNGSIQGRNTFINDVLNMLKDYPEWGCQGRSVDVRPAHKMDNPEPLILEYGLNEWKNATYTGNDVNVICTTTLKTKYSGLQRC